MSIRLDNLKILNNDYQALLGNINCRHTSLGILYYVLTNLLNLWRRYSIGQSLFYLERQRKNYSFWIETEGGICVSYGSFAALKLIIFTIKLSQTGSIALGWIYLHQNGHKILMAYLTLLSQLVNQGRIQCQQLYEFESCCIILPQLTISLKRVTDLYRFSNFIYALLWKDSTLF